MQAIEITTGTNGYPSHLHRGYIGFESIEEAERFADEMNGDVVALRRRDGWQFWESRGWTDEPFNVGADTYGDDYSTEIDTVEWERGCREMLSDMISREAPLEDIRNAVAGMMEVRDAIEGLGENEAVLLYQDNFCEIIRTVTMSYSEDVWYHEIGVELKGWENDDR